ncbi:hypothetical protein ACFYQQ_00930 [Streptomyces sp. NPDC005496]|uniref:hypothetical protein n=1 Tax=unclassified Streptomyces TaxID=2593676 RepID=UPI0033A87579
MSAPVTRDPLVVNTQDGAVWMRRAVTREGRGLYAVADAPACCPEYVMATMAELAEHGLASMSDALPVPVGPERLTPQERDMILGLIGDVKPARSSLLVSFGESVRNRREHEHPQWEDFYCLNLSSYMGERSGPVLRRLVDVEAENERLRVRVAELEQQLADAPVAVTLTAEAPDALTRTFAPTQILREDPHDGPLVHRYQVGRDLPETGGAR